MSKIRVVALSGGVGGAKLALGLDRVLAPGELMVVANTGDDFEHLGLYISPDIDTLLYSLSSRSNPDTGWGRAGDTWSFMSALADIGGPTWFQLGDQDLAVHVSRTLRLRAGASLSEVTADLAARFGIVTSIVPMSNDTVRTRVRSRSGWLDFQDYFVRKQCRPAVHELRYCGAGEARAAPGLTDTLHGRGLDAICICPSNPYLSIDPILAVNELRAALMSAPAPVIAVSPIVAGHALKGPTAKIMTELGFASTVERIAFHYQGLVDGLIIDEADRSAASTVQALGMSVHVAKTVMRTLDDRCALAHQVLTFAGQLRAEETKTRRKNHVGAATG